MDPTAKMGYGVAFDLSTLPTKQQKLLREEGKKLRSVLKELRLRLESVGPPDDEDNERWLLLAEESYAEVLLCDSMASPQERLPDTGSISGRIAAFLATYELPLVYRPGSTQIACSWFVGLYWS